MGNGLTSRCSQTTGAQWFIAGHAVFLAVFRGHTAFVGLCLGAIAYPTGLLVPGDTSRGFATHPCAGAAALPHQ